MVLWHETRSREPLNKVLQKLVTLKRKIVTLKYTRNYNLIICCLFTYTLFLSKEKKQNAKNPSYLKLGLQNIISLFDKVNFVSDYISLTNMDLIFLTETWLKPAILESMIAIDNFAVLLIFLFHY